MAHAAHRHTPDDTSGASGAPGSTALSAGADPVPGTGQAGPSLSLPPTAALTAGRGGQPRLLVDAPAGYGEVYLHGATVTSWRPRGSKEVIFTSRQAVFDGRTAIRGGVPLCLPVFSDGIHGDARPRHGWARTSPWRLLSVSPTREAGVRALFLLSRDHLTALYEVEVGHELVLSLSLRNDAASPRTVEAALHTYLAVHDVTGTEVSGLDGAPFTDNLSGSVLSGLPENPPPGAGGRHLLQRGPVTVSGPVDRIYRSESDLRVSDPGHHRVITVRKRNAASTIVWNPWSTGSAAMPDMADDEFASMLCVEAGAVRQDAPTIMPGESWSMRAVVGTEPA
ncbi:D-hexose-6-phosphate mutarotase [Actinomyces lilanjuaniae]|uniref:glucose-6-phosphate 1-epimerase n=1 Tax=Actinomyces lilanjuaniae TaxID=2321394 RepID=A0ABM6Z3V7_9ACTO|nr:D-hexose-6-phosphate mutarotase [Actinomyces lilanjuaniae]AYD89859.1 D-hexose-6-phosphate mutarotase [Actinomyces lilanjuaniae]